MFNNLSYRVCSKITTRTFLKAKLIRTKRVMGDIPEAVTFSSESAVFSGLTTIRRHGGHAEKSRSPVFSNSAIFRCLVHLYSPGDNCFAIYNLCFLITKSGLDHMLPRMFLENTNYCISFTSIAIATAAIQLGSTYNAATLWRFRRLATMT